MCSGWNCNMWDILAPLRAVRPSNGGCGFDEVLAYELRTLNFDVPASTVV